MLAVLHMGTFQDRVQRDFLDVSQEKKMEGDSEFHKRYASIVNKYQEEGSSRQVRDEEVPTLKQIWYLPHHAVWHPRKPDDPRVVFDCASKSKGISLNSQLLQGPENTSLLIGVILRFRFNSMASAVAADIKRMFHQVFVTGALFAICGGPMGI